MVEHKDASKSFTLSRTYIASLFYTAVRQGKQPLLVIKFPGFRVTCTISKE